MKTRFIEMSVGAFMVLGIVAMVTMALRVSGLSGDTFAETYTVKAYFENLGGLTERATVSLAGVNIGRVKRIYLDKDRYSAVVEMEINKNIDNLSTDSSAAIMTAGILGEKYIAISVGGEEEFLQNDDWIDDTQSAVILEELIGRFLYNMSNSND